MSDYATLIEELAHSLVVIRIRPFKSNLQYFSENTPNASAGHHGRNHVVHINP
jgi:hypothetical protein